MVFQVSGLIRLYCGRWRPLIARAYNVGMDSKKDAPVNVEELERSMTYVNGASMFATRSFVKKAGLMPGLFSLLRRG